MRLLQGQTILEDDRKLCEYSLTEGTTISALFEPDIDINIEVTMGHKMQSIMMSNAMSVKELKAHISVIMTSVNASPRLDVRLGEVTLQDWMPHHFSGITDGSQIQVLKPYVGVTILNNHGTELFWRLERKDSIKEVKAKLTTAQSSAPMTFYLCYGITGKANKIDEIQGYQHGGLSAEGMRLYLITEGRYFNELADDETVEHYKIKDGYNLYLLSYRWTYKCNVRVTKVDAPLPGVEQEDTCLGIKVKVQDQLGIPANLLMLLCVENNNYRVGNYFSPKVRESMHNSNKPFNENRTPLVVFTNEEWQVEGRKREELKKKQDAEFKRRFQLEQERQLRVNAKKAGMTVQAYKAQEEEKLQLRRANVGHRF